MAEWPKMHVVINGDDEGRTYTLEVVPADWYEKRTELARELYEALDIALGKHPPADPQVSDALARYEREVGE